MLKAFLIACIPVYAGAIALKHNELVIENRRKKNLIQKDTYPTDPTEAELAQIKGSRTTLKTSRNDVNWQAIKNPEKGHKVVVPSVGKDGVKTIDVYRNRAQVERHNAIQSGKFLSKNFYTAEEVTTFFKNSIAASAEINKKMETQYSPRTNSK